MAGVDGMFIRRQIMRKDMAIPVRCVMCSRETGLDSTVPIAQRIFYVEGVGQLCKDCHEETYPY